MKFAFLKSRVPLWTLLLSLFVLLSSFIFQYTRPNVLVEKQSIKTNCSLDILRMNKFNFTKPLIMVDLNSPEERLNPLRSEFEDFLSQRKSSGKLTSASVYFRDLNTGKWISINPSEEYTMGSIMKIMTMLAWLKNAEENPAILNKSLKLDHHFSEIPDQKIVSGRIVPGQTYTVEQLLKYMIIDSDNDATALLNNTVDFSIYTQALKAMNLKIPDPSQWNYDLNVIETSRLMRILYNSSFLKPEYSELALEWMNMSSFKMGFARYIDPSVAMPRKFGERGVGNNQQLHETAIVYAENHPYVITVLTKGSDQDYMSETMAELNRMAYEWANSNSYQLFN